MTPPFYHDKFFKYAWAILMVLAIIFLFYQVDVVIKPILELCEALFLPIVFSILFYYLLRPLVHILVKLKIPRIYSIVLIYIVIGILLTAFFTYLGPILVKQMSALANLSVETFDNWKKSSENFTFHYFHLDLDTEIKEKLFTMIQQATAVLSKNLVAIVGFLTHLAVILAVIPFIVFYLLKDDHSIVEGFIRMIPSDYELEIRKILRNIDTTLSSYINGLVLVSSTIGLLLLIGYAIIGLQYALVLAIIAVIFTTIPFLGPFLAIAPALLIGATDSPFMMFKVFLVFVVIQQFESNVVSPQIIGHRLHIHPLTIILLLIAAGSMYGLIGMLLATPIYAISKVLIENLYKIYLLRFKGLFSR